MFLFRKNEVRIEKMIKMKQKKKTFKQQFCKKWLTCPEFKEWLCQDKNSEKTYFSFVANHLTKIVSDLIAYEINFSYNKCISEFWRNLHIQWKLLWECFFPP